MEEDESMDSEQDQAEIIKELRNKLRVAKQMNKRRGKLIERMKSRPATVPQMRRFLRRSFSQAYTNWILTDKGTLKARKKRKGRMKLARKWTHTGMLYWEPLKNASQVV